MKQYAIALSLGTLLIGGCSNNEPTKPSATKEDVKTEVKKEPVAKVEESKLPDPAKIQPDELIKPIEATAITNADKVELGKKLYFEPRLSLSGAISCNSCHNLATSGTDNLKTSIGHKWQEGPINSPTVFNAKYNLAQFWDGRAKDLKEQAGGPIANPKEMASTHELALSVLNSIPEYKAEFKKVYQSETITIDHVTDAIAVFEETLVTPNSRFDRWIKGDQTALTDSEKQGYALFKDSGCISCHNGVAVGGSSYQKLGLFGVYQTKNPALGRFDVTKQEADKNVFKVPTLRNIELTAPYFHDGEVKTLTQAVDLMGKLQLNKTFTPQENERIVAFLKTLTGERPHITLPLLPPSTDKTPEPKPFN